MADTDATPAAPETAQPGELKNDASTPAAPQPSQATDNSGNNAEVERLRKEAEQARMRANQLENELSKRRQDEEEARRKQLEEREEYKTLYEREREERERILQEREDEAKRLEREATQKEILGDYPQSVIELAETTGVSLLDTSEEARASLKGKLDAIAEKLNVKSGAGVKANNPGTAAPAEESREQLLEGMKVGWKPAANKYISTIPAIKEMKRSAGLKVD